MVYRDRVHILTIYTREAHPVSEQPMVYSYGAGGSPIEKPSIYQGRVALATKTIEEANLLMPVLVDEIDSPLWCSYGCRPNNACLIGMDGRVVLNQA